MREIFLQTENVVNFRGALEAAQKESGPKIILVKGKPGLGKTKTSAWFVAQHKAIYLQAEAGWNIGWFLDDLCWELGLKPEHKLSNRSRQVKDFIYRERPTILIDEADLLRHDYKVLETIKSVHDRCDIPVVLIGTDGFDNCVERYPQFKSRILQCVEFKDIEKNDLLSLFTQLAEVEIDEKGIEAMAEYVRTMRDLVRWVPHLERAVRGGHKDKADGAVVKSVALKMPRLRMAI